MNMSQDVDAIDTTSVIDKISIISPIDQYVKTRVITDSIKLIQKKD